MLMFFFLIQSHSRSETQPDEHHRVQSAGRVERHAGVHLQQRGNQSDWHQQTSCHQEEAASRGQAGEDGVEVNARPADWTGSKCVNGSGNVCFFSFTCRRLWQHVTKSLKEGNMDKATEHKHRLEECQRGEERQRAADNKPWRPKYFTKEVSVPSVPPAAPLTLLLSCCLMHLFILASSTLRVSVSQMFTLSSPGEAERRKSRSCNTLHLCDCTRQGWRETMSQTP